MLQRVSRRSFSLVALAATTLAGGCHSSAVVNAGGAGGSSSGTAGGQSSGNGQSAAESSQGSSSHGSSTCGTGDPLASLPMDMSGRVSESSNSACLAGQWSWWGDNLSGGKSTFPGLVKNSPPYVAGKGMCIAGSTPGGRAD